ncbi:MAG: hypothetical protein GX221_08485 [Candidatus Riflebacteria bacterium]|nr:hypothetical protein [Candidatus Riflebacteria bacterium]
MSIKPVDVKTAMLTADSASQMRENQMLHEAGAARNVAQQQDADQKESESVHKTENAENTVIRKENEKSGSSASYQKPAKSDKKGKKAEPTKVPEPIGDGIHGTKIDLKA